MTVYLDASALLALHIDSPTRRIVVDALENDPSWASTAVALGEAVAGASRLVGDETISRHLEDSVRHTWDFLHVVPVDPALLDEATHLCRQQPIGMSTAMHLAGAMRLPAPVRFVTFDASQIPVALSLGFDVVSG